MNGGCAARWKAFVKAPVSLLAVMVFVTLLSLMLRNEPALAADGCPAPGFATPRTFNAGPSPRSVAMGDFNGNGKLDLVVANVGLAQNSYSDGNVSVLLNKGDGTFHPAVRYTAGLYPRSAAVGDFNGDGKADIVAANSASSNVSVLLGHG